MKKLMIALLAMVSAASMQAHTVTVNNNLSRDAVFVKHSNGMVSTVPAGTSKPLQENREVLVSIQSDPWNQTPVQIYKDTTVTVGETGFFSKQPKITVD